MTARQPRRTRRRNVPGDSLPRIRPETGASGERTVRTASSTPYVDRNLPRHHVSADYGYVRKDLAVITGVSIVTFGFVVAMSFIL